ncbi:hypothetical protein HEP73_00399 [Xanthomonas sp. GW]|nr:hypothetical protein HEP73_00399 [Xanthomonas sp. GW]
MILNRSNTVNDAQYAKKRCTRCISHCGDNVGLISRIEPPIPFGKIKQCLCGSATGWGLICAYAAGDGSILTLSLQRINELARIHVLSPNV